jgi:hypothetical protein
MTGVVTYTAIDVNVLGTVIFKVGHNRAMLHPGGYHTHKARKDLQINAKERQDIGMFELFPNECFLTKHL